MTDHKPASDASPLPTVNLMQEQDARVWAAEFLRYYMAGDDDFLCDMTMTAWFASALMAGYDRGRAADAETIKAQAQEIEKLKKENASRYDGWEKALVGARQSQQNATMMHATAIGECRKINKAIHRVLRGRNNAIKQLAQAREEIERLRAFIGEARRDGGWGQIRFDQATAILAASEGKE